VKRFARPEWYRENGAVIAYLILAVAVAVALADTFRNAQSGQQSHEAICALRTDLIRRVGDSERFLKEHPTGIPGISRADIERSLHGQRETIHALAVADC
jgi:hypothetical protein